MNSRALVWLLAVLLLWPALVRGEEGAGLRSVQAEFTQEKRLPILARPLISRGSFAFQSPDSLRWEYTGPLRSLVLLHQGRMEKFIDRDGALVPDNGAGVDTLRLVLQDIGSWLDGRFADNPQFAAARSGERTVVLTPKEPELAALISRVELELGQAEGVVERLTIHEGPEAFTRLVFTNIVVNRPIPPAAFTRP